MRQMPHPIPVLTGSEYRDRKTMKKHVIQNTTGKKRGTCGQARSERLCVLCDTQRCFKETHTFNQQIYVSCRNKAKNTISPRHNMLGVWVKA